LFPLYDGEDTESWWNSGIYFRHESTMLYPNHILQFNTIEAINQEHRLYPKNLEWERIDNNFKASIRDNKLKKSFRPLRHLSPSLNGRVGKNLSYTYKQEKLSRLFDFNNKIFKRRFTVNKNIADGEPYAVCDRSRLPYLGEYISKNWGTKVAAFIFGPLVVLFELKKKIFLIVIKTKEIIHEYVGAILETTRSWRHLLGLRRNIGNTTTMETIDKIIIQHGSNEDNFFIIQIGSNDGCTGDPIHKFVKHYKWKGVFVEPVPYIYKRLKNTYKDYNGLIFENVAINIKDGYRTFYRIKKNNEPNNPIWYDQLGSFKKAIVEKHRNEIPNFDKHLIRERVRCLSVGSLFNKYNISKIDLLHIDAEGYDFKIIKQVPFSYIKPGMILYECQNLSQSDNQKCEKLLKDQGYRLLSTGKDTFAYMPLG
jgi:FkbM family methyltransferase